MPFSSTHKIPSLLGKHHPCLPFHKEMTVVKYIHIYIYMYMYIFWDGVGLKFRGPGSKYKFLSTVKFGQILYLFKSQFLYL